MENIVFLIGQGHVQDILEHPNQQRYGGGQRIFVIQRDDYVYLVGKPSYARTEISCEVGCTVDSRKVLAKDRTRYLRYR